MRNLFFALILANLGFAAWQGWHAADAPVVPSGEREFGDILLASEFAEDNPSIDVATARIDETAGATASETVAEAVSGDDVGGAADETGDTAEAVALVADEARVEPPLGPPPGAASAGNGPPRCISIGPFRELSQVSAAAANLRADGYETQQRTGEGEIWSGYWVYLERIASVAVAQTMIETLHDNGIGDAYVIPDSDSGTLVSLGVFSEIIRASRIREQVRALGFNATIADRVRRATVYWIDVNVPGGTMLDFERLQPPGRIVRLEQRPCSEVEL